MPDAIQFAKDEADYNSYFNSNMLLVLYFTASWCGPCQAIRPQIENLYQIFTNVEVVKVDFSENPQLAVANSISSVPTFIFYRDQKQQSYVKGANLRKIVASFEQLSKLDPGAVRNGNGSGKESSGASSNSKNSKIGKEVAKYIPASGYEILNGVIDYSRYEALNVLPFNKKAKDSKKVFQLDSSSTSTTSSGGNSVGGGSEQEEEKEEESTVLTDADSQGIFYFPFLNDTKIYSILLKLKPNKESIKFSANSEVDEDDADELQPPSIVKVWKNKISVLSFDDTDSPNDHLEKVDVSKADENNWYEIKLRFVKFQGAKSLNIFIEGADDDYHTIVEKIVLVGINGESLAQQTISAGNED